MLGAVCAISVWPLLVSQTIPAFQQDWTWPLSRALAIQWLHAFVGLWDPRSLGQGNALPWQTYAVVVEVAIVLLFGPATGLAIWIAALEFGAGCCCAIMLAAFGVRSHGARLAAALLYALGPVAFTRIAAGHLAYMIAYALLPLAICLARRTLEQQTAAGAVALGLVVGISGCQVQFLAIAWLAVLLLVPAVSRAAGWKRRLALAAAVSVSLQLQAALPLIFSSTASLYAAQPPLLSFEYNNSSPFAVAPIMLGYFTHYYESHALAGAFGVLYVLLVLSVALAILAAWRTGFYAVALIAVGALLTAGLYGPLSGALAWAFEHVAGFAVFRDLHYFAALTAVGGALALGVGLQRAPGALVLPALILVSWTIAPTVAGAELARTARAARVRRRCARRHGVHRAARPGTRALDAGGGTARPARRPKPRARLHRVRPGGQSVGQRRLSESAARLRAGDRSRRGSGLERVTRDERPLSRLSPLRAIRPDRELWDRISDGVCRPRRRRLGRFEPRAAAALPARDRVVDGIRAAGEFGATYLARIDPHALRFSELRAARVAIAPRRRRDCRPARA